MQPITSSDPHITNLRKEVNKFPTSAGVYIMKDQHDHIIYIGKGRNIRARVRTYFIGGGDGRKQIEYLLRRVRKLETIVTEMEEQALVLERDLINKHKPRYNIRLKDDKSYISIRVDKNVAWPKLELVRKVEQDGAIYIGPFTEGGKIKEILDVIKKTIPLRTCNDTVFYNRQRPCLEYQLKHCSGPCCLAVDKHEYAEWLNQAIAILEGRTRETIERMNAQMEQASKNLFFEQAAAIRDRVSILEEYSSGAKYRFHQAEDRDAFAIYREAELLTLCVINVRHGRISDSKTYHFQEVKISNSEILNTAILQYHESNPNIPEEIILLEKPVDLKFVISVLRKNHSSKVEIVFPKLGSKFRLLQLAALNAKQSFYSSIDAEQRFLQISKKMSQLFSLSQVPRRIECIDISNLQGSNIVGAQVSFFDGHPDKSNYKKYKLSFQGKPDDFAAIAEVVRRRLARGKAVDDLPDLLIIDGGALQLARALFERDKLSLKLDIIALAKTRNKRTKLSENAEQVPERVFIEGQKESISLDPKNDLTHFLERIRDEAHRFVIAFHRKKRSERVFRSLIDDISGIGPERRTRLLKHFGNINSIKQASANEIAKIGRMPLALAKKIKTIC